MDAQDKPDNPVFRASNTTKTYTNVTFLRAYDQDLPFRRNKILRWSVFLSNSLWFRIISRWRSSRNLMNSNTRSQAIHMRLMILISSVNYTTITIFHIHKIPTQLHYRKRRYHSTSPQQLKPAAIRLVPGDNNKTTRKQYHFATSSSQIDDELNFFFCVPSPI